MSSHIAHDPPSAPHPRRRRHPPRRTTLLGTLAAAALTLASGLAWQARGRAESGPQIGKPAPDFAVTDTRGKLRKLSELKGKVVVLEWTNADCPFVKKHYESKNMQKLQREATAMGAIWLSVISSAPGKQGHVTAAEANQLTTSRTAVPSGVLLDPKGSLGRSYGAQTTPHMYVIDKAGVLRYMGGIDSIPSTDIDDIKKAKPLFQEAFMAVTQGKPVAQAVTRPYGCSVKYD